MSLSNEKKKPNKQYRKKRSSILPHASLFKGYFFLTWKEILSNKLGYFLGFFSCLLVVVVVALMVSILAHSPVVFTRLAELQHGEIDIQLNAAHWTGYSFLNYSLIANIIAGQEDVFDKHGNRVQAPNLDGYQYHTPRHHWTVAASAYSSCDLDNHDLPLDDVDWRYFGDHSNATTLDYDVFVNGTAQDGGLQTFHYQRQCGQVPLVDDPDQQEQIELDYTQLTDFSSECFDILCPTSFKTAFYVIDSMQEKAIDLGRDWDHAVVPEGEVFISDDLASSMGNLNVGDSIFVNVNLNDVLGALWHRLRTSSPLETDDENSESVPIHVGTSSSSSSSSLLDQEEEEALRLRRIYGLVNPLDRVIFPLKIARIYDDVAGKYSTDDENALIVEYATLLHVIADNLHPNATEQTRQDTRTTDLYHYAQEVIVNLPPQRFEPYTDSNLDNVQDYLIGYCSTLLYAIGFDQIYTHLPIFRELYYVLRWFSLFLGLILNIIIFILLFLSILLIYSLLMVSVETRTFQMGIMRMVGMQRRELVQLVLIQALSYSIPSIIFGLLLAKVGGILASHYFLSLTGIPIDATLTTEALFFSVSLGLAIPMIASVVPISAALSKNLHDSIDSSHTSSAPVELVIERSSDNKVPVSLLVVGTALIGFGFMIYYLLPLSLLSTNLTILLNMFFMLLLMMLLGLVLLSLNAQHLLEKLVVYSMLFWDKIAIRVIVLKNLVAHRRRNRMTTIMYALSLGFLIFLYVSYDVQITSVLYQKQQSHGAYMRVSTPNAGYKGDTVHSISVLAELEAYAEANKYISGFAYRTDYLKHASPQIDDTRISNIGHVYSYRNYVYATSANFFHNVIPGFLVVDTYDKDWFDGDLMHQAYSARGSGQMMIGSLYKGNLALDGLDDEFLLTETFTSRDAFSQYDQSGVAYYKFTPLAFVDAGPAMYFSPYPLRQSQDALLSLPTYLRLTGGLLESIEDIPIKHMLIQFKDYDDISDSHISKIKHDIRGIISENPTGRLYVWDFRNSQDAIEDANLAMLFFFGFTIVVAMLISFFSLMSSMVTNIHEQAKEIGVLRSLGIPKTWMIRIYVYEAFTVVFSSSLMGIMIGTLVGWTISLQRVLFTSLPVPFHFPFVQLFLVFILSTVFAFVSAYSPIKTLLNASVIKNLRTL